MKVVIRNKNFVINKNVVVCIIEADLYYNSIFSLEEATIQNVGRKRRNMNGHHPAFQTLSFKGLAKCNASDTFSENIGKNLAEKRALIKMYSYYRKFFRDCCKEIEKVLGQFEDCQDSLAHKENELDADLTALLMEV